MEYGEWLPPEIAKEVIEAIKAGKFAHVGIVDAEIDTIPANVTATKQSLPRSRNRTFFVNWPLVEEEMRQRAWNLTNLKNATEGKYGVVTTPWSIDNAKAGMPVIKATVCAIAAALDIHPPERFILDYQPPVESLLPELMTTQRTIILSPTLKALEDVHPFSDELLSRINGRDEVDITCLLRGRISLHVVLEMSARDAAALDDAFNAGNLEDLNVHLVMAKGYCDSVPPF